MCAINPLHKKRVLFDFYTAHLTMTKEDFDKAVIEWCLDMEIGFNRFADIRLHVKETKDEAE
jgi:hypothetical protein